MARRGVISSVVCGEAVWSALAEARPHGLSTAQLQLATKLGTSQVRRGILYIREISALEHASPLTWSHSMATGCPAIRRSGSGSSARCSARS